MNPEPKPQYLPRSQRPITPGQLRILHVGKKQLGLDEAEWRALLGGLQAASARDLNQGQVTEILRHFKKLGFVRRTRVAGAPEIDRQPEEKRDYLNKVWKLLAKLRAPWAYGDAIAQRMHGIEQLSWCDPAQIHDVIIALEYEAYPERKMARKPETAARRRAPKEAAHGGD